MKILHGLAATCLSLLASGALAQDQAPPTPQQRVAMLKQWLQASQAQLRNYEWIETTVVAKDGEEKSRTENRCYYGVDGVLQKVAVSTSSTGSEGGLPGILTPGKILNKVGQHKKQELEEYTKSAAELAHSYVPPSSDRIQQSVNAGKFALRPMESGRVSRLEFSDYLKAGDLLSVDIEMATNRLTGMHVTSYVEDAEDAVALDVGMGLLPDGTIYTERTTLDAQSKGMTVTITNAGHRRTGG